MAWDFTVTDEEAAVLDAGARVASDADPWGALQRGGWLDLLVEDPDGGLGWIGLIAEQLGAAGVALPLVGTAVVWPTLFGESSGGGRVAVADVPPDYGPDADAGALAEDGTGADVVIVWSQTAAGAHVVGVTRRAGGLDGDGLAWVAPGEALGFTSDDATTITRARQRAAAVAAAEMAGALRRVAEMTAAHVAERHQFGRPLSAFQVVAHGAARLAIIAEAATWAARWACREDSPAAAATTKGWASRASAEAGAAAHQLHGAIGFTEEYGLQALTKRLRTLRFAWGDDAEHFAALGGLATG